MWNLSNRMFSKFQKAGLPEPSLRLEMALGKDTDFAQWFGDIVRTLQPQIEQFGLHLEALGDLETLQARLQVEVEASSTVASWPAYVGAWSRKPVEESLANKCD